MDYFFDKDGENSKCATIDVGKGKDFPKEIVYPSSIETEVSSSCSDNNKFKVDEVEVENSSNMNNSPGDQQEALASSDEQIMRIISESHDEVYPGGRVNKNDPVDENESAYESTTDSILKNVIETNILVGTHEEQEPVTENVETMSTEENSELDEALPALDHTTSDEDSSKSNLSSEVASSQDKIKIPNIFDSFCNENSDVTTSQGSSFSDTSNKEDKESLDVPENPSKSRKLRRNNNFDVNQKNTLDSEEMITDMSIKTVDHDREIIIAKEDSSTEIKEVNLTPDSHEEKEPINKDSINLRPYSHEEEEPIHKEFLNLRPDSQEENEWIHKEPINLRPDTHEEKELIPKDSIKLRPDSHEEKESIHGVYQESEEKGQETETKHCQETIQETRDNHKDNVLGTSEDSHESVGLEIKEESRDDNRLGTTEDSPEDDGLETTEDSPEGNRLENIEDSPEDNGFGTTEDSCEGNDLGTTDENDSIVEGESETEPTEKFPVKEKVSDREIAEGVDKLHTSDDVDMNFREETEVCREESKVHSEETEVDSEETEVHREETEVHREETEVHKKETKDRKEETEVHGEETEVHGEKTEVHGEETEVHEEETEVHGEETEVHGEETEVHGEEKEVHGEETDVHREETEVHREEMEVHSEETEVHREEMEVDTKLNVKCMLTRDTSLELPDNNNKRDLTEGEGNIIKKFKAGTDVAKTTFGTSSNFKVKDTKEGEYDKRDARKEEIKSKESDKITAETTVVLDRRDIEMTVEIQNNTVNGLEHKKDSSFHDAKETTLLKSGLSNSSKSHMEDSSDTHLEITKQSRKLEKKLDNSNCDEMNVEEECMNRAEESQNKIQGPENTLEESSNLESEADNKEQKEARNFDTLISPDNAKSEAFNVPEDNQENTGDAYLDYDEESIENISRTIRSFSNEKPTPKTLENRNKKETSASKRVIIVKTAPNVEKVKRKLEEILERSKGEEDAAIAELQRMKREKTEILNAITTEMEKLKSMLVKGKQG